jgi:hypothetical protein
VAKNNRAFAPLRALQETILRGKKFRAFVANLFVGHKTNNGKS